MLYYDRIERSEKINLAENNNSKDCTICYFCCHDLTMLSVNINNFAIITVKNVDYRCVIHDIIKYEATY